MKERERRRQGETSDGNAGLNLGVRGGRKLGGKTLKRQCSSEKVSAGLTGSPNTRCTSVLRLL